MKISIYQVNMERDNDRVAFMDLESTRKFQKHDEINSAIYEKVYTGDVECQTLEAVYSKFNLDHPAGYAGRSLSVSDIVEIKDAEKVEPGFYFCDSYGFSKVSFDSSMANELEPSSTIRVVYLEPGKKAQIRDIDKSLEGLQCAVGGYIEAFYPFEEAVCIACNEEGKIQGMPLNRAIRSEDHIEEMSYGELVKLFRDTESKRNNEHMTGYVVFTEDSFSDPYSEEARTYVISSDNKAFIPGMGGYSIYGSALDGSDMHVRLEQYMANEHGGKDGWKIERCYTKEKGGEIVDIIAGPFFICDCSGENFASLSDEQLARYSEKFKYPEKFFRVAGEIHASTYDPDDRNPGAAR